ncbi:MAG: hypothetical protein JWO37_2938 [Acidimicrobiales bacterium]|jgi:hypothetical protein|nr:hypothetical protein [Acidimicrobiales bacterium]
MSDLDPSRIAGRETLPIRPWPDPVIDALGHDPRSPYVERFWLGILGPSTTLLMRRLAAGMEASPNGFDLSLSEAARALGIGGFGGKGSPFVRALMRCCTFDLAHLAPDGVFAVRRKLPPLNRRQVSRLSETLQAEHEGWQLEQLEVPVVEQQRRRAKRLALSLFELGEDPEGAERQLHRWRFHPAMAREATAWAWDRHRAALAAAEAATADADADAPEPAA